MAGLDPDRVRRNLEEVRAQLPDPETVTVLAAVKYLGIEDLPALWEGGIRVVGENRAQALEEKAAAAARLRELGASAVHDVGICTICDERYFSHRRSGGVTGRQAGVAWLG